MHRFLDPGKPVWEESRVNKLIEALDIYYDKQVAGWAGAATGGVQAKAGPDFWRLSPQARLAMAQELQDVMDRYEGTPHADLVAHSSSEWFDRWLREMDRDETYYDEDGL